MRSIKVRLIKKTPNWKFILNNYIGIELEGRIHNTGHIQAKLKRYIYWFSVPKDCIEVKTDSGEWKSINEIKII